MLVFFIKYKKLTLSNVNQNIKMMPFEDNIDDAKVNGSSPKM
jgi:hypothetical protein